MAVHTQIHIIYNKSHALFVEVNQPVLTISSNVHKLFLQDLAPIFNAEMRWKVYPSFQHVHKTGFAWLGVADYMDSIHTVQKMDDSQHGNSWTSCRD